MARRPTIADVAAAAGVSVATVDRVLNARHPVREETARRVYEAATGIGYHAAGLIRHRIHQNLPFYNLGFVLQRPQQHFYQALAAEISVQVEQAVGFRGAAHIDYVESVAPGDVVAKLKSVASRSQAVAMVTVDHPAITAAVAELRDAGVPVFSLLSDFAQGVRTAYIGLDNRKVGRTAAWFIHKLSRRPGKVVIFVGSHRFLGHEQREIGLRTYFRENAPDFEVLDSLVNLETRALTREVMLDLLASHDDLAGVYAAGGGMEGVIAALREENASGRLVAVCNESTEVSRVALADHVIQAVIATPVEQLVRKLLALMIRSLEKDGAEQQGALYLPFDIRISENI